jgi:flagellar motor switch protein FliN/FliY
MNQMVGSASTSLSSMLNHKVDIDTPHAFILDFKNDDAIDRLGFDQDILCVTSFRMEIGNLIDSEIMQLLPVEFAKDMIEQLSGGIKPAQPKEEPKQESAPTPSNVFSDVPVPDMSAPKQEPPMQQAPPPMQQQMYQQPMYQQPMYSQQMYQQPMYSQSAPAQNVNVQPVQFPTFVDPAELMQQKENIGIIMDVPLEVTVELGRTHKLIKEILDFSPGTVIELDKVAGEPIDILVNGKFIAKGEVVVIDENFGIRITEIVKPEERI